MSEEKSHLRDERIFVKNWLLLIDCFQFRLAHDSRVIQWKTIFTCLVLSREKLFLLGFNAVNPYKVPIDRKRIKWLALGQVSLSLINTVPQWMVRPFTTSHYSANSSFYGQANRECHLPLRHSRLRATGVLGRLSNPIDVQKERKLMQKDEAWKGHWWEKIGKQILRAFHSNFWDERIQQSPQTSLFLIIVFIRFGRHLRIFPLFDYIEIITCGWP